MNLPDFRNDEGLNTLKAQMGIPRDVYGSFPGVSPETAPAEAPQSRAFILLKSGRRLDLLDPQPGAWTDEDLAIGLSRTYRWGGYSKWALPLSVAQHSLTVLALREVEGPLTAREALRELLHDATEALFGGFDPIAPLRPHLGPDFARHDRRLQAAVDQRYLLPPWTEEFMRGTSMPIVSPRQARPSTSSAGREMRCDRASGSRLILSTRIRCLRRPASKPGSHGRQAALKRLCWGGS